MPYPALLVEEEERKPIKSVHLCEVARLVRRIVPTQVFICPNMILPDFERMTPYIRELSKKQAVTAQSLEKIEDGTPSHDLMLLILSQDLLFCQSPFLAAYAIVVRSSEYDLPPDMLDDIVAQSVSNYNTHGHETRQAGGHRRRGGESDDEDD